MTDFKTQLDLGQVPTVVGKDGMELLERCYGVLEHTRWPIYIVGPSGSGKSIIAMNLAKRYALAKNVPAYYVQLSPEQTKTSLILGLRLENGSLTVKNGVVADCMERGGVIIVDEATHSVQEILLMFNSILDRTSVTAIGDKMIYAHENFRIVFCANDSRYAGNVKLPQSFAQRLVSFYFDYPAATDELLIVDQIVAEECKAPVLVPVSVKRYIIELMREMRSNTYPLSVRNAAIAVVLCNLQLLARGQEQVAVDAYFANGQNAESAKRYMARRILGVEAESVLDLTDERIEEFEQESGHGSAGQGRLYVLGGSREDGYVFAVNRQRMQEAWLRSALKELLEPEAFMMAFIVSELSVLKYEQGGFVASREAYRHSERLQKDGLYYCVYHSLLRKFSEYRLARELPEFGKLLALFNMGTQATGWYKLVQGLRHCNEVRALEAFLQYGVVDGAGVTAGFYDFMVPLALAAIRTELEHVVVTTQLLCDWLEGLRLGVAKKLMVSWRKQLRWNQDRWQKWRRCTLSATRSCARWCARRICARCGHGWKIWPRRWASWPVWGVL